MWRLGFFFHEMSFGLLSIFLPLYVVTIGGSLIDVGIMSAIALLSAIPASFFWGYACDKSKRYKRYILISFLSLAVILFVFTFTTNFGLLVILYSVLAMLHVAHEPPKNVLIAELYSHEDWQRAFAFYEGFTEVGWLIGLVLGFFAYAYGFGATVPLLICSSLNLIAFLLSLVFVVDPLLIFERSLVNIERSMDFAFRGMHIASQIFDGLSLNGKIKREDPRVFFTGLLLFSVATSMLFTPLPIFFSKDLALPTSMVFAIFVLNSSGGALGYFLTGGRLANSTSKNQIGKIVAFRGILTLLLIALTQTQVYSVIFAAAILILMGFAYAIFLSSSLSLSMEIIPAGKAGLFYVLLGIGGASGSFLGPLIAQTLGFTSVFLLTSTIFFFAYATFKLFASRAT
jgi:MFS family permease